MAASMVQVYAGAVSDRTRLTDLPFLFLLMQGVTTITTITTVKVFFLHIVLLTGLLFSATSQSDSTAAACDTITSILISGNHKTKTDIVLGLSGIKVGLKADSSVIRDVKTRLVRSGLFSKVDVLLHQTPSGTRIYIILVEKFYLLPYDFGGELYSSRYGQKATWWRLRVGMEYSNFRGKSEVLRTSFSFWDWKSLGLSWYKPLLPTPYYFGIGARVDAFPDEIFKIDHTLLRASSTFGRKLPGNSRIDLSFVPLYRRRILFDDSLAAKDTVRVYEAFTILNFRTDHRDRFFQPKGGWLFNADISTNSIYTRVAPPYTQLSLDLRKYLPGFVPSHSIALRTTTMLRDANAGVTHRLLLGGEGSIRGYARNQFGLYFYANNSFTVSCEYRFALFSIPDIPLFPLDQINPAFTAVTYRFDGAVILDYGRISEKYSDLFDTDGYHVESGIGAGLGLRYTIPEFEHTVCFDVVWGTSPWSKKGYLTFMSGPAAWHFYLDTYF